MRTAMLTARSGRIVMILVAAGIALSWSVAADAEPRQPRARPANAQVAQAQGQKANSPKRVFTEEQKYCRAKHACAMEGPPCKKCGGK